MNTSLDNIKNIGLWMTLVMFVLFTIIIAIATIHYLGLEVFLNLIFFQSDYISIAYHLFTIGAPILMGVCTQAGVEYRKNKINNKNNSIVISNSEDVTVIQDSKVVNNNTTDINIEQHILEYKASLK